MKKILWTMALISLSFALKAQSNYFIKGSVADTIAQAALENASVVLLNGKDSTIMAYTRAKPDGSFNLEKLNPGSYMLLVTYPKYADFVDRISLDSIKPFVDLGKIKMILKSNLLADVIIKGKAAAIKIKGDTTEFNASSFVIEPNSRVEDLLKQLPGIQVDKDGKITAQGQSVKKVLVDGEEFFGDDPTLVTKNIRGDMVDKVQLYDKKSDQATFTGIDDGEKTKTINIKLKEDKKTGYFGKIDAGSADGDFYQGQGMVNHFKAKQKASAYTTLANTGKTGLGWQDGNKYGASSNVEISDDGGIRYFMNRSDDMSYNGQGIPSTQNGGIHYENKWNNDKSSINSNYKVGAITVEGTRNNRVQNEVSENFFYSQDAQSFSNYTFRQKLDATYELKLDSTSTIKVVAEGTLKNTSANTSTNAFLTQDQSTEQITNLSRFTNDVKQQSFAASAFYTKKLKKAGRTYSVRVGQNFNDADEEGYLFFENKRFDAADNTQKLTSTDQLKTTTSVSNVLSSNITYTEPLSKQLSLVLNYGLNLNNSTSRRLSFNKKGNGYSELDTEFSNSFELDQLANEVGAVLNFKKDKRIISFGSKFAGVDFDQLNLDNQEKFERNFVNVKPQASFQYNFSQQRSFSIRYNGSTRQPAINQIQPIRVNNDPLNIQVGNENLKPSFESSLNMQYYSYKMLSNQSINLWGYYSFDINPIVGDIVIGESQVTTQRSVNISDKVSQNFNFGGYVGNKLKKTNIDVNLNFSIGGGIYYNYINRLMNRLQVVNYSGGVSVGKYVAKKYNFRISINPGYNTYDNSVQSMANNNGATLASYSYCSIQLPGKFEITSELNYNYRGKTDLFNQSIDYFIWNSGFSRKFLKNESLKLTLSGNDLLKQNIGFERKALGSAFTENRFNTVNRYFLFSLLWDFNKMGGGLPTKK